MSESSTESVFYRTFERHNHAEGLKAHSTHYCPGCGHGLIHKYLGEAIEELGLQDRTVAISPVGCAVFMYYYLDVGNTQAAHGRAPAVAIGHKTANPDSIVVSYQGDGDLASIGLAEIMQAAQLGLPISVIFVNNAIYGMTGGQMAPTTLMGQRSTTCPDGRTREMGQPLRMAETLAQLDGPVYVERVALYDPKQRKRAAKAIRKSLRLQAEGKGFSLVEVLSECPTHLKKTPAEAEAWVRDVMTEVFPLGVLKDTEPEPWFAPAPPVFEPRTVARAIGGAEEAEPRFMEEPVLPEDLEPRDLALKFAGAGGDGAQTIAALTCRAAINEGFDSTYIPSYGPESRGGTSYADIHVATEEVLDPASPAPHALIAFNPQSLEKFGPRVRAGGIALYDETVIEQPPSLEPDVRMVGVQCTRIATDLGEPRAKNMVALGALQAATGLFPEESLLNVLHRAIRDPELLELNQTAFRKGQEAAREQRGG
jgi:2-oxoisovalerate ferredoxin oxidoreductase beta subunit